MKMFVWEDVLSDYTSGMVCVLARTEKEAWKKLYEKYPIEFTCLNNISWQDEEIKSMDNNGKEHFNELAMRWLKENNKICFHRAIRPKIITEPEAFAVWGGG